MDRTVELLVELTKYNNYISSYIDKNIKILESMELDELEKSNKEFYGFLGKYDKSNKEFDSNMKEHNLKKVDELIPFIQSKGLSIEIVKDFKASAITANEKMKHYTKILSAEMNMINKIKHFKTTSNIDFSI